MATNQVILNHDGAIDEFMATALLATMENIELLGVVITPADCLAQPAASVTSKVLGYMGLANVPVAISNVRGVNPFPWVYRQFCMMVDLLPFLNQPNQPQAKIAPVDGSELIEYLLDQAPQPATLLVTCPLTTVAQVIGERPDLIPKISQIIWMGGSIKAGGNIDPGVAPGANFNAEWNVYWDPPAVEAVFNANIPIILFPLDVTNLVPVDADFVLGLAQQSAQYPLYDLAGQCYAMVAAQTGYCFWDVVTTIYLTHPEYFQYETMRLKVETSGEKEGQIIPDDSGCEMTVAMGLNNLAEFYQYIQQQWQWVPS